MEISGRRNEPWDALFIFHFLSLEGFKAVPKKLQDLVSRETGSGTDFNRLLVAGKRDAPFRLSGRLVRPSECSDLLSQWNQPDGKYAFMCYTPNHGIATVKDGALNWWALICFQCSNAEMGGPVAHTGELSRLLSDARSLRQVLLDMLPERLFPELS